MVDSLSGPVAVTGSTGYVASHIVRELLDRGATVHATARDPNNDSKVGHLKRLADALPGKLRLFAGDLLVDGDFDEAIEGCPLVMHTASPFVLGKTKDAQATLVDPALKGTRNVLTSVSQCSAVQRVVLTSSVAAAYGDATDCQSKGRPLNETDWNETSSLHHRPYPFSKTVAEREAWKIAEAQERWKLVCLNPGFVMGPSLTARNDSASIDFMLNLINGTLSSGIWQFYTPWVDVRDVAIAHVEAGLRPDVAGRYLLTSDEAGVLDVCRWLEEDFPGQLKLPRRKVPKLFAYLLGPFKGFSWKYIRRNVDIPVPVDHSRSVEQLGIRYRPLRETVRHHVEQLLADGLYVP